MLPLRRLPPLPLPRGPAPRRLLSAAASAAAVSPLPWPGLSAWRRAPPSDLRTWGPNGPCASDDVDEPAADAGAASSLAEMGALVLSTADPLAKARRTHAAFSRWAAGLPVGQATAPDHPARPDKPLVVTQKEITTHKEMGVPLNAYMLHNLAHVELNAIDLAWDTVVRFAPLRDTLGDGFFADFARVADDESRHFRWYSQRLGELGFSYGDMPVHNLLWRECAKSSSDVSARLAVIPLVQVPHHCCFLLCDACPEARGLDAGPRLVQRLSGFGDHRSADIVARVAEEELAHVSVGLYWFLKVCQMMGREPGDTFKDLIKEYGVVLKGPFNYPARDEAGIPREWYDEKFKQEAAQKLSEVHDRLACIVEMEKESASLND
ncbi:hypothetical protein Zm00014a_000502 [Zea mays]|uniref:DUF455 family protein n=1 Tax=Zea mays TaxID=4577 RepID=A0A3L6FJM1_MAIZE|nr:hypothetical protein Zm00014a_000502 [Zea mays]PWZ33318.1 hypothetical protein Zm00014a_000502 [Zea mays]PWZ33319.1 hypothetical protein Zm00014a_000502 [Zea mays]PWZ33320.1 hypothetical protein Zm00014a_000502 [Zea mays]